MTRTRNIFGLLCLLVLGLAGGTSAQTQTPNPVTNGLVRDYESAGFYQDAAKTLPDSADAQKIAVWTDQSASAINLTQATAATQPAYKIYQFGPQPGVSLTGSKSLTSTALTSANLTIISIQKTVTNNTGGNGIPLLTNLNGSTGFYYQINNGKYEVALGSNGYGDTGAIVTSAPTVTSLTLGTGVAPTIRVNGTAQTFSPVPTGYTTPSSGTLTLGVSGYSGTVGAKHIYNRILTTTEESQVELYLSNKYYGTVPGTTTPSPGTPQTFPVSSIERWGSWFVPSGNPLVLGLTSTETQLAFNFTGTEADILFSASTGVQNPLYAGDGFTATIDGAAFDVPIPTADASGQNWLPLCQNLPDGPHTLVLSVANTNYTPTYNWQIDATTPVRIFGANPACFATFYRLASGGLIIVFEGDSRTYGFDATGLYGLTTSNVYPGIFKRLLNNPNWTLSNQGTYSELASVMVQREPTDVLTQFNPANTRNVMIYWGAVNDGNSGATQAQMTASLRSEIAGFKAKGGKEFIALTVPYTGNSTPSAQAAIQAYNADLLKNGLSYGVTAIGDVNNDQAFSAHLVNSYWNADALHMTNAGYQEVANVAYAAFQHETYSLLRSRSQGGSRAASRSGQNN